MIWTSAWIGIGAWWSWFVYTSYVEAVSFPEPDNVKDLTAAWGQVGDYFGGVLNPVFGFLTILMLLRSLEIDRRALQISSEELRMSRRELRRSADANKAQLSHWEEQAKKDELFRLVEMLSRRIDEGLGKAVYFSKVHFDNHPVRGIEDLLHNSWSIGEFLQKAYDLGILNHHNKFDSDSSIRDLRLLVDDLTKLTSVLISYGKLRESSETVGYYWFRYLPFVRKLLFAKQLFQPMLLGEPHCPYEVMEKFWRATNSAGAHRVAQQTALL